MWGQYVGVVLFAMGAAITDMQPDEYKAIGMSLIIIGLLLFGDSRWGNKE